MLNIEIASTVSACSASAQTSGFASASISGVAWMQDPVHRGLTTQVLRSPGRYLGVTDLGRWQELEPKGSTALMPLVCTLNSWMASMDGLDSPMCPLM